MPNPLKVLVDLQARRNVSVSGTLEVTGSTRLAGLTATGATINGNVSGSGTLQIGGLSTLTQLTASTVDINGGAIDGVVIGAASQAAAQFTTLSASSTLQAGGAATLAGGLTVTGAALNASAVAVSASALNITNDISARSASLSGDLTVAGNLTVVGTTTQIASTTVNIGDKNLNLATGSSDLVTALNGGGIDLGTNAEVQWRYDHSNVSWTSNKDINVSGSGVYKIGGTQVLSSNALGNGVTASSLTSVGTLSSLTVSGLTNLSGNVNLGDASSDVVTALGQLTASQGVSVATGKTYQVNGVDILSATELKSSVVSASLAFNNSSLNVIGSLTASVDVKATGKLYAATSGTLGNAALADNAGVLDVAHAILLLDDSINGASVSAASVQAAYNKVRLVTTGSFSGGSATINLSSSAGANAAYFVGEQKHYLSVDVLIRNGAADADWENDLVAVHLSGSGTGSGAVSVIIDALTDATEYRLIVVNEKSGSFVI